VDGCNVTFHLNVSIFGVPIGDIVSDSRDNTTATTAVAAGGRADKGTSGRRVGSVDVAPRDCLLIVYRSTRGCSGC